MELIGDEWEKFYNLNTLFSVFYYPLENYYGVVGSASWKAELVTPFESNKAAEEFNLDYISFTWGGENKLILKDESYGMSGFYHNKKDGSCAVSQIDKRCGIIWQFYEKSVFLGSELSFAQAYADLMKPIETQGKMTSVKMTYVHTFNLFNAVVTLAPPTSEVGIGPGGITVSNTPGASLEISNTKDSWQIQMDVILDY